MQLEKITFRVTGISPIMFDNAASMQQPKAGKMTGSKKEEKPVQDIISAKLYVDDSDRLYLPSEACRNSILDACSGRKLGKVGALRVIRGSVFPVDERIVILNPKNKKPFKPTDVVVDTRSAVNRNSHPPARIINHRPKLTEWYADVILEIDTEMVEPKVVLELLNVAGKSIGWGSFRVQNKGTFGRFTAEIVE